MKNRNLSSPILSGIVLALVASPLLSKAETGVASPTYSAVSAQPAPAASTAQGSTITGYIVVTGDSLTSIAQKFKTTRKKLKALNALTSSTVKPGQVLQVPAPESAKSATAALTPKAKKHRPYAPAQPVQDFDIPASTFASCPVPSSEEDADAPAPGVAGKHAPVANLVSPSELTAKPAPAKIAPAMPPPQVADTEVAPSGMANHFTRNPGNNGTANGSNASARNANSNNATAWNADDHNSQPTFNPPPPRLTSRGINLRSGSSPTSPATTPANDWGNRFLQEARALGNQGIEYDEDWRPPGESRAWTMDCSNTSRYIYKVTTGIQLPRTASDQYYYLHLQGKAWDVPETSGGLADTNYLRDHLKPGDLLFWENTYRPERQPPITHVMVFLGANEKGQWIMAGSQNTRGGEHNRSNGGVDIYVFRPSQPSGGYSTWLGLVHHHGRFCAFGRPLEADPTKLAVAAND